MICLSHLRRGSVMVAEGQFVEAGERIGVVGNSGNPSESHLHIHAECEGEPRYLVVQGMNRRFHKGSIVEVPSRERKWLMS
nr:M23 family metallopeptidase [Nocardia brevicatena]